MIFKKSKHIVYFNSVIVLCFVVCYFVSILVLQSSRWGRESWLLCFVCLPGVSWLLMMPQGCLQFVIVVFPDHTLTIFYACTDPQSFFRVGSNFDCGFVFN